MQIANSNVFLCYNSADEAVVADLARRLLLVPVTPWLDLWNLVPGDTRQEVIEKALNSCSSCLVCVGPNGLSPWQNEEVRALIDRRVTEGKDQFRIIPVFLPGVHRGEEQDLPDFLRRAVWVEFHQSLDDEMEFYRLICGIQGKVPGPSLQQAAFEGDCPYRGLQYFDVQDDQFFFGRDALKGRLFNMLRPTIGPRQELRFISILGPSGSGKTSLARAGLIAGLEKSPIEGSSDWLTAICRPGANPLESLAIAMIDAVGIASDLPSIRKLMDDLYNDERTLHLMTRVALRKAVAGSRLVLLVDQFEEVFTLCLQEDVRQRFFKVLLYACGVVGGQTAVVISMRTDFYGRCASDQSLATAVSNNQVLVGAMTRNELRSAIEQPAYLTGFEFEPGLVDGLLDDADQQAGALPLLQHALLELWERRSGRRLTHIAYESIGRLAGALDRRAEKIFEQLSEDERHVCRRILLRLIQPGLGTEATKRRVPFQELLAADRSTALIEQILTRLTAPDARLLTTQAETGQENLPTVEISHEALIRSWSRLREWIEEDRQGLLIQRHLTEAATEWKANGSNDGFLYRGARLAQTIDWARSHDQELTTDERNFLQESADKAAQESRLSAAATLDQLESSARGIWMISSEMQTWLNRAGRLVDGISDHRSQLDRYHLRADCVVSAGPPETWAFPDTERQFQHDILANLIARLERFRDGLMAAAQHVYMIRPNLEKLLREQDELWRETILAIQREPRYCGLQVRPQIGLMPLGKDPRSGLQEFAHLLSGVPPKRSAEGELLITELSGVILVLLPGGSFRMGAERPSPQRPLGGENVDAEARDDESPVHPIVLSPFFMSKHPMTQGQWLHGSGWNPSFFQATRDGRFTSLYPVECVSWPECQVVLQGMDLLLPTEAQWEYAARAGTTTMWWTGNDPEALREIANLSSTSSTPAGHFDAPNGFGLHDVIGNVWEWCRDSYGPYNAAVREGDAERLISYDTSRMSRGGSFFNFSAFARSAIRYFHTPAEARFNNRGVRPARKLLS